MSFSRWVDTRSALTLESLGDAIAEHVPELVIVPPGRPIEDLSDLGACRFALTVGEDVIPADVTLGVRGARSLSIQASSDSGASAVALAIALAALKAAGGKYGDDGDSDWTAKRVERAFEEERDRFTEEWARTPAAEREERTRALREERAAGNVAALCEAGADEALARFLTGRTVGATTLETIFDASWRAKNPAAARASVAASPAAAVDALRAIFRMVGSSAVRQAEFLVDAGALAALSDEARSALAAEDFPDEEIRALLRR